jgi:peptidoglycan/LPS O-acetylase OafA/YrhL
MLIAEALQPHVMHNLAVSEPLPSTLDPSRPTPYVLTLDLARGVLAASIMIFHGLSREALADIERIGYYGVYGFFVISGMSLYLTYRDRLGSRTQLRAYFVHRWFRIAPLFALALALRLVLVPLPPDAVVLTLLNATLLFGFVHPGATSLLTGGWSIGIEMVFYALFPVVVWTLGGRLRQLALLSLIACITMFVYANHVLRTSPVMTTTAWAIYTQPVAFFGYFTVGCLLGEGYLRPSWVARLRLYALPTCCLALLAFLVVRVTAPTHLLQGWTGIVLATATVALVAGAAFAPCPRGRLATAAHWLGVMSYPVYLLHPLVHTALLKAGIARGWRLVLLVLVTLGLATLTSRYIESPARRLGRRLSGGAA